ncbi:hypothetical protein MHYP_G00124570 [Metynnis hypsauchen]
MILTSFFSRAVLTVDRENVGTVYFLHTPEFQVRPRFPLLSKEQIHNVTRALWLSDEQAGTPAATCLALYKEPPAVESGTGDGMELREAAALRQQRRIKQAIQFLHKDSADLLPLDGLKKLGTSKEGQPHNILQRRLLEANLSRNRLNTRTSKAPSKNIVQSHGVNSESQEMESDLIQVVGQCSGREVVVTIDTGCTLNLISSVSVEKLGLKEKTINGKSEDELGPLQRNLLATGQIALSLVIGQTKMDLLFSVVEIDRMFISLGMKTLKSLKCVIDIEKQLLVLGKSVREQIHFAGRHENEVSME